MSNARKNILKQLLRKPAAVFGSLVIFVALLAAVFAYWLTPDSTENANLQTVEIQSKPAGYRQTFLRLPLPNVSERSAAEIFLNGRKQAHDLIPIRSWQRSGPDSIAIDRFIDEDTSALQKFALRDIGGEPAKAVISREFVLGTDAFGRDILSRLIIGTRISLAVGFIAVIISLLLGISLGAAAGYYGKRTDAAIMWFVNVVWSIPTLLLVFALTIAAGKGFLQIFIAIGLTLWINVARLVRAQVMAAKELDYVRAARALGFRDLRIILRHILPNIIGPVAVLAAGNFATAIILEAGLSFLGVGVQPPQPSWGLMLKENYNLIITNNAMQALIPGFAIMLLVLAFNLLGNAIRDVLDVRS